MNKIAICLSVILLAGCSLFKKSVKTAAPKEIKILMETNYGAIKLKLYNETPLHRDNFVKLVKQKYYDSLLFHRVINGFMMQGGDPTSKNAAPDASLGGGDIGYKVNAEFNPNLIHKKGTLAAARDNNPQKASSGCQFYIVEGKVYDDNTLNMIETRVGWKYTEAQRTIYKTIGGTPFLDNAYTVYGEVISGLNVVDSICKLPTKPGDRPVKDVRIIKCRIVKK
jgi:peptidyl-prolyl cis-trans isomerase B (cyclophilin B)